MTAALKMRETPEALQSQLEDAKRHRLADIKMMELMQRDIDRLNKTCEQQAEKLASREATIKRMDVKIRNLQNQVEVLAGLKTDDKLRQRDDGSVMSQLKLAFNKHKTKVRWNHEFRCVEILNDGKWSEAL